MTGSPFLAKLSDFLILVAVLQKFLYRPIIQAMERRERTISDRRRAAEQKCQLREKKSKNTNKSRQDFATERSTMLAEVKAAVAQTQTELMQGIRTEVEEDRSRWQEIVQRQKDAFLQELRHRALQQIQETIRQVLAGLSRCPA
ncbi:MAG UNVERIFIED_CONTAM: hypothetical protein LVR29_04360 [Microcystis novacekii LVE1205-3]